MRRPGAVHFICIETKEWFAIKTAITLSKNRFWDLRPSEFLLRPSFPLQAIGLLRSHVFKIKIEGVDNQNSQIIFSKIYQSDVHGNFDIKIYKSTPHEGTLRISVYEVGLHPGIELLVGHFIPLKVDSPKRIVISDFDKTLVDTRYSTTKEMYYSLTRPLSKFPKIEASITLFKSFIDQEFRPFVLTASPHFYEGAIRDWLYQNEIYTAGIFLKDYRILLNPFEWNLTTKDLKNQGHYKLQNLIQILLMTGIPDELVLMGDGFESDSLIYLTLLVLLRERIGPWQLWKTIKLEHSFRLNSYQDSKILNKIYQLNTLIMQNKEIRPKVRIYIRCGKGIQRPQISLPLLKKYEKYLEFYEG